MEEKRLRFNGIVDAARLVGTADRKAPVAIGYDWREMRVLAQKVDEDTLYVDHTDPMQEHIVVLWRPFTISQLFDLLLRYEDQHRFGAENERRTDDAEIR